MSRSVPPAARPRGQCLRGRPLILALCLGLLSPAALARKPAAGERHWVPVPALGKKHDPRLQMHGTRASFRQAGVRVDVELLDARRRGLFLASAQVAGADPFSPSILGQHAWTFLLRLENGSEQPLAFRPPTVSLFTKKPLSVNSPCDYLCLVQASERAGLGEASKKALLRAAYDSAETIGPGERVSKILVFVGAPPRFKQMILQLVGFNIGREALRFSLPFAPEAPRKRSAPPPGPDPFADRGAPAGEGR
ncbi:MAG: hypothetical protein ACE5IK_01340 [Acidobacteriota bacterium]